jgi:hypothetical protein
MIRKVTAMVSATALAATAFAPAAQARDWHGYHGGYGHYGHYYGHSGNVAAAGVLGLVLGVALGAAISQPRYDRCYDGCGGPPPQYRGYRDEPAYGGPGYDEGSAYEQDYGQAPYKSQCTRHERQFDRYANRYVTVDVPC